MSNIQAIKQAIRDKYAWPGGYPIYLVMSDGDALSIDAARQNWPLICRALIQHGQDDSWYPIDPWRPIRVAINWEDSELFCCHTGEKIESAYGDDSQAESA